LKMIEYGLKNFTGPPATSALRALQAQTKNLTTVEARWTWRSGSVITASGSRRRRSGGNHVVSQAARATSPTPFLKSGRTRAARFFAGARGDAGCPAVESRSAGRPEECLSAWREFLYRDSAGSSNGWNWCAKIRTTGRRGKKSVDCSRAKIGLLSLTAITVTMASKRISRCIHAGGGGGTIAFHDIVDRREAGVCGVPKFWRELKQNRRHLEL